MQVCVWVCVPLSLLAMLYIHHTIETGTLHPLQSQALDVPRREVAQPLAGGAGAAPTGLVVPASFLQGECCSAACPRRSPSSSPPPSPSSPARCATTPDSKHELSGPLWLSGVVCPEASSVFAAEASELPTRASASAASRALAPTATPRSRVGAPAAGAAHPAAPPP